MTVIICQYSSAPPNQLRIVSGVITHAVSLDAYWTLCIVSAPYCWCRCDIHQMIQITGSNNKYH